MLRSPRPRSLRTWTTVAAALLAALPVLAVAVLTAVLLRNEVLRADQAPARIGMVCTTAGTSTGTSGLRFPGLTPERTLPNDVLDLDCAPFDETYPAPSTTTRVVEPATGGMRFTVSTCDLIPVASWWPFTDPESIDVMFALESGQRTTRPIADLRTLGIAGHAQVAGAQRTLNHQVLALFAGAFVLIALVAVAVGLATGRVLRPVEAIRREMAEITERDLTRRVPVPTTDNEIARLATTMNTTLDRLHAAVAENRRFVADASHELRGPIAALRTELEIAAAHPELTPWPVVLDSAISDVHRLQELATDLLLLARLDTSTPSPTASVDLVMIVREEIARRQPPALTVVAELHDDVVLVPGSPSMLTRMLANLLDNAERHAASGITVRLVTTGSAAVLEVVDDGPGVPMADRERVFDRFTRLDDARTRDSGGTGLGLAIARRVATTHRGTLTITGHDAGARFTATIPLASDETDRADVRPR